MSSPARVPMTRTKRVFVVGAGASVAPPAGLPLFAALRAYLIGQLQLDAEAEAAAVDLAPETFMRCLHDGLLRSSNG
jgi:hypothetical protein